MEQTRISSTPGAHVQQPGRSRRGGEVDGADASSGGFFALLSALDEAEVQGSGLGDVSQSTHAVSDVVDMASEDVRDANDVPAGIAAWQVLMVPDTARTPQWSAQESDAMVLDGHGSNRVGEPMNGGASHGEGMLANTDAPRHGLVAETALLDGDVDLKDAGFPRPVAAYGQIMTRMQSTLAQRQAIVGRGTPPDVMPVGVGAGYGLSHFATPSHVSQGAHDITATVFGQSVSASLERAVGMVSIPAASESLLAGNGGSLSATVDSRSGNAFGHGGSAEGQWGSGAWAAGAPPLEAGGADATAVHVDPAQAGAEELVTDQVAYWINQKTQNAEMTLDRDGQPVEVSVSLSGNEAHVTFRSDQSETRELLDRSMTQLSDLLRAEGLVLSGASVGTSARDGADDARQPRSREGARQAQVVASATAEASAVARSRGITERSVDIFV